MASGDIPTFSSLPKTPQEAADFLIDKGFIEFPELCPKCGHPVKREQQTDPSKKTFWNVRCQRKALHDTKTPWKQSVLSNTLLGKCKLPLVTFVQYVYMWLLNSSQEVILTTLGLTTATTATWTQYLMDVTTFSVRNDLNQYKIGGEGIIVEIDESKFGKRKYNVSELEW